jgi:hypothetical protein
MTNQEQIQQAERQVLTRELAGLTAKAGAIGGALGGGLTGGPSGAFGGRLGGRRGGRRGAERAARRLTEDRFELTLDVDAPPVETLRTAAAVLAHGGTPLTNPLPRLDHDERWAVVGSGLGRLNRAVVRVSAIPTAGDRSRVVIRAVALEGVIKRHGGQKAAKRIRDALIEAIADPHRPALDPEFSLRAHGHRRS